MRDKGIGLQWRWLALGAALLVVGSPLFADEGPTVYWSGTLDLATPVAGAGGPGEAFHVNVRGDSPFDNLRLRLLADVVLTPRLTLFNQILIDPSMFSSIFGVESFLRSYLRYEVFAGSHSDLYLQAGKIPTPFGTFGERAYSEQNPLMGTPLMYHYFTSLRPNQLPADNADLLRHRGQGQIAGFTGFQGGGSFIPHNGPPMVYDGCWDVGVEAVGSLGRLEYLVAVTQGTVSAPRFEGGDDNGGQQVAVHLGYVPAPALRLGGSFARGPYLSRDVEGVLAGQGAKLEDFEQEIWGFDLDFSVGHLRLIAEYAQNRWQTPNIRDALGRLEDLENEGWYVEGKYKLRPGLYAAARYGELNFGRIDDGTASGTRTPWDADVERLEVGLGYHFNDRFATKAIWQDNRRAAPVAARERFGGIQLTVSF